MESVKVKRKAGGGELATLWHEKREKLSHANPPCQPCMPTLASCSALLQVPPHARKFATDTSAQTPTKRRRPRSGSPVTDRASQYSGHRHDTGHQLFPPQSATAASSPGRSRRVRSPLGRTPGRGHLLSSKGSNLQLIVLHGWNHLAWHTSL